ncbi:hypothetical protein MMC10_007045 [Thelotrema lepadinum]|nr:hypothetical protein [Thelotrema lepadinum]
MDPFESKPDQNLSDKYILNFKRTPRLTVLVCLSYLGSRFVLASSDSWAGLDVRYIEDPQDTLSDVTIGENRDFDDSLPLTHGMCSSDLDDFVDEKPVKRAIPRNPESLLRREDFKPPSLLRRVRPTGQDAVHFGVDQVTEILERETRRFTTNLRGMEFSASVLTPSHGVDPETLHHMATHVDTNAKPLEIMMAMMQGLVAKAMAHVPFLEATGHMAMATKLKNAVRDFENARLRYTSSLGSIRKKIEEYKSQAGGSSGPSGSGRRITLPASHAPPASQPHRRRT